jgi:hypothetical protein
MSAEGKREGTRGGEDQSMLHTHTHTHTHTCMYNLQTYGTTTMKPPCTISANKNTCSL